MDPTPHVNPNMAAVTVAVGGLVLALTQSTKRFTPEGWGPLIAAIWTTLAMFVWAFSQPDWPPVRTATFELLAVWVAVYTSALGLYSAAMVPSNSRQQIGTGGGNPDRGNTPVGEAKPPPLPESSPELPDRGYRPPPAPEAPPVVPTPRGAVLTEPVVQTPARRPRPRPTVEDAP